MQNNDESKIIRLVNWLVENPRIRRRVCEDGYGVEPDEFIEIMEMLEENKFYELSVVFLIKNINNEVLDQATTRILVEKMGKEWERIGMEQMYKDMKNIIREEIEKKSNVVV